MNYKFSNRALNAKPSLIRQISMRAAGNPNFISLSIGNPAYESFPVKELREMNDLVYERNSVEALQYGPTEGWPAFRTQIEERLLKTKGIKPDGNKIIVTTGSQQGLDLVPRIFCNEDDVVLVESFTYLGALSAMRGFCAKPLGIQMDADGINIEALEEALKTVENVKYLYLVPNFQNPSGITIPFEKRKKVYELACKYDILIYEDDPYGELRYSGEPVPAIKSLDTEGRVIYAGSFSKVLAAGLRVGFLCCADDIWAKMVSCKGSMDSGSNITSQLIASYYIEKFDLDEHIEKTRALYAVKCATMKSALDEHLAAECTRTDPDGGMFVWVTMPDYVDEAKVFEDALDANVGVIPSLAFAPDEDNPGKSFRLCFSAPTIDQIKEGVRRFGEVTKKHCTK